ncbi:GspH/FimT family protein [Thermodesulfitimonas sp.]
MERKVGSCRDEAGFTILEVLVLLVVAGVLLGIVFFPLTRSTAHWDLVTGARELVSHLRATRDLAVTRGVESVLTIYQNDNCYRFERVPGVWETVYLPARVRFAWLTFANPPVAGMVYEVRFNPSGSSGNGGKATLQSVTGEKREIVVFGPTGRVRVE